MISFTCLVDQEDQKMYSEKSLVFVSPGSTLKPCELVKNCNEVVLLLKLLM